MNEMSSIERYVPVGTKSLSSDAPGWTSNAEKSEQGGPTCWKCKGQQKLVDKKACTRKQDRNGNPAKKIKVKVCKAGASASEKSFKTCPVCYGKGSIPPKKKEMSSLSSQLGMITRKRKYPKNWKCSGPVAHAVKAAEKCRNEESTFDNSKRPLSFLYEANTIEANDAGVSVPSVEYEDYPWYPSNKGEQMCNLVGNWRILQRVGSHRWTTDDIVTAYIAIQHTLKEGQTPNQPLRYLDLGCGNGSVLQMTSWGLLNKFDLKAYGIEARSEAARFARRSLSFNIGKDDIGKRISVIRGDFRDLERDAPFESIEGDNDPEHLDKFYRTKGEKFDLVTGTPPYFQVDFNTVDLSNGTGEFDRAVTSAVINQGGMPTSIQSAPARCEFRGGIEEYCKAAATILLDDGIFVVCENWLNNKRVYEGAKSAGLKMLKVYPIKGKSGRKENLFGVYVLKKKSDHTKDETNQNIVAEPLSVRSECGKWTLEYAALLESMAIPSKHVAV